MTFDASVTAAAWLSTSDSTVTWRHRGRRQPTCNRHVSSSIQRLTKTTINCKQLIDFSEIFKLVYFVLIHISLVYKELCAKEAVVLSLPVLTVQVRRRDPRQLE